MKIYGKSDDLIYIEGDCGHIYVEHCDPSLYIEGAIIITSDGTQIRSYLNHNGWNFSVVNKGCEFKKIIKSVKDVPHYINSDNISNSTNIVLFKHEFSWAIIDSIKYKISLNNGSK